MSSLAVAAQVAALVAAASATAGAVVQGVSNYQQGKVAEAQNKFNAAAEKEAQKQAYQEESLNSTQQYRAGRQEIAAGLNLMENAGNVGTSAESALRGGYFNLSEDISALRYKYENEAIGHGTAALNYKYNAKVANKNRKIGVLASSINTTSAASEGTLKYAKYAGAGAK